MAIEISGLTMEPPSHPGMEEVKSHCKNLHPVHQMRIKEVFEGLTAKEKLYAHHMSRCDMKSSSSLPELT
jgi:hypothetical protein